MVEVDGAGGGRIDCEIVGSLGRGVGACYAAVTVTTLHYPAR